MLASRREQPRQRAFLRRPRALVLAWALAFGAALPAAALTLLQGRSDIDLIDLRSIAVRGLLDGDHLAALAAGKALLTWHARHRFCANCGADEGLVTEDMSPHVFSICDECVAKHGPPAGCTELQPP